MFIIIELKDGRTLKGHIEEFTLYPRDNHSGPCFVRGDAFEMGQGMFDRTMLKTVSIFNDETNGESNAKDN